MENNIIPKPNRPKQKIEGYWYSKHSIEYLMPVPYVLTQEQADEIYELIKQKEKTARVISFRGVSTSRLDGSYVGSQEYHTDEWIWPQGFAEHYVKKYRVKPSIDFLKYIGYDVK